jgi:hypothetical protein
MLRTGHSLHSVCGSGHCFSLLLLFIFQGYAIQSGTAERTEMGVLHTYHRIRSVNEEELTGMLYQFNEEKTLIQLVLDE